MAPVLSTCEGHEPRPYGAFDLEASAAGAKGGEPRAASPLTRILDSYARLSAREAAVVEDGQGELHKHAVSVEVLPESAAEGFLTVAAGWAAQSTLLEDGRRQIVALVLPGELVDLTRCRRLGLTLTALTPLRMRDATRLAQAVAGVDPAEGGLLLAWRCCLEAIDQRLVRQIVRLGRLSAYDRTVDLLVALHERQRRAGMADMRSMSLPLTQEALADHLGLSIVHVNRTLQQLRRDDLIAYQAGRVTLPDPNRMIALAAPSQAA